MPEDRVKKQADTGVEDSPVTFCPTCSSQYALWGRDVKEASGPAGARFLSTQPLVGHSTQPGHGPYHNHLAGMGKRDLGM